MSRRGSAEITHRLTANMDEEVVLTPAKSPGGGTLITMLKVPSSSALRHNASPVLEGPYQGIIVASKMEDTNKRTPHVSRDFRVYVMNPFLDDTHPLIREKRELHFWFKEEKGQRSVSQGESTVDQFFRALLTNKDDFPPDYVTYIKRILTLVSDCALIQRVELQIRPLLPEDDKKEQSFVIRQNFSSSAANQSLASLITHANKPKTEEEKEIPAPKVEDNKSQKVPEKEAMKSKPKGNLNVQDGSQKPKSPALPRKPPGLASKVRSPAGYQRPGSPSITSVRAPGRPASPAAQIQKTADRPGSPAQKVVEQPKGDASPTPKPRRSLAKSFETSSAADTVTTKASGNDRSLSPAVQEGGNLSEAARCATLNRTEQRKTITINKTSVTAQSGASDQRAPSPASDRDDEQLNQADRCKTINRTEKRKTITIANKSAGDSTSPSRLGSSSPQNISDNVNQDLEDDSLHETDRYKTITRTESRKTITIKPTALSQQAATSTADKSDESATDASLTQTDRYKTITRKGEERKTISLSAQAVVAQQDQPDPTASLDVAELSQADKEATLRRTERRKTLEVKPQVLAVQQSNNEKSS